MHFVLPLLFYYIFSTANGCTENSDFEMDVLETQNSGQCDDGSTIVLDRLLEQRLGQLMQDGELNMENLMVKLTEMLKDSNLQSLFEESNSRNKPECDISNEDRVIQMPTSEVGGACGVLN